MFSENLLIIFVKNPVVGKVKTRLAATIGDERALQVYKQLLMHTRVITESIACDKAVFYADEINEDDLWDGNIYQKFIQAGNGLGERMQYAFEISFFKRYKSICIIGSDCFQLTRKIIEEAFQILKKNEFVLGPTYDGGYYLLGMNKMIPAVFQNKRWSTETVLAQTVADLEKAGLSYTLLEKLTDIDEEKDLQTMASLKNT